MDQPAAPQPKGNIIAGYNPTKTRGDALPHFRGRISKPGETTERRFALWANKDKRGNVYFSGRIDELPIGTDVYSQLDAMTEAPVHDMTDVIEVGPNLSLRPNEIILFRNQFKDDENGQPDFWGRAHFGDNTLRVGTRN